MLSLQQAVRDLVENGWARLFVINPDGIEACSPETSRLKERTEALRAAIHADPERVLSTR